MKKPEIKRDGMEVVVFNGKGKEILRLPYSQNNISVAHDIYMSEKYTHRNYYEISSNY